MSVLSIDSGEITELPWMLCPAANSQRHGPEAGLQEVTRAGFLLNAPPRTMLSGNARAAI
jgi:hypothetical protein